MITTTARVLKISAISNAWTRKKCPSLNTRRTHACISARQNSRLSVRIVWPPRSPDLTPENAFLCPTFKVCLKWQRFYQMMMSYNNKCAFYRAIRELLGRFKGLEHHCTKCISLKDKYILKNKIVLEIVSVLGSKLFNPPSYNTGTKEQHTLAVPFVTLKSCHMHISSRYCFTI